MAIVKKNTNSSEIIVTGELVEVNTVSVTVSDKDGDLEFDIMDELKKFEGKEVTIKISNKEILKENVNE